MNVTVTLNSTDNESSGSGVAQVAYSASGTQTIPTTTLTGSSASFTLTAEGITTITFFGTDNAGNVETPKSVAIRIDKTPPTISGSRTPTPNASG